MVCYSIGPFDLNATIVFTLGVMALLVLVLFSEFVGHFLYGSLFRALAASLGAENAARLVAMQGAEKNIDSKLVELRAQYRQRRQMNFTEELLDIVSGFKALEQRS
ncbi:MAG: F0F1 ATP synthase subunit gamma [Oceanidesulfovibrio sp.]